MQTSSPPASGAPRSVAASLSLALRTIVLVQSIGLVWTSWIAGSDVETFLFSTAGLDDRITFAIDRVIAIAFLVVAAIGMRRPLRAGYALMAAWYLVIPLARGSNGGAAFAELATLAHAVRWAAPLAVVWLGSRRADEAGIAWTLRAALAATFAVHGYEALASHPQFVDYLLLADQRITRVGLDQRAAETLLACIGVADIACAAALLAERRLRRGLLAYMAFWGVLTASARVVHAGEHGIHEALIRAANGGVALALFVVAPRVGALRAPVGALRVLARPPVAAGIAACALVVAAGTSLVASGQPEGLTPHQLRIVWAEEPATHARVSWSTADPGTTHAVYYDTVSRGGDPSAYTHQVTTARTGQYGSGTPYYHHAELEGLSPSTTYYFVAETDGALSEELHFVTGPADDRTLKLLYGGDSRSSSTDRRAMNSRISQLVTDDASIVALAHGGDYIATSDDWDQWDEWLTDHELTRTADGRVLPIIATRGNHEGDGEMFNHVFGFPGGDDVDYYVTHLGANATLITLDSNVSHGGDQRDWLEAQLIEAQARRWIVPGYHRPAFPAVKTPGDALEFWVPLFEMYEVDLVCESDGHALKRTVPIRDGAEAADGIVYVGEGGLGVSQRTPVDQWYLDAPGMAMSAHHVQVLTFAPDELRYDVIGMDGEMLDSYVTMPKRDGVDPLPPLDPDPGPPPMTGTDAGTLPPVGVPDAGVGSVAPPPPGTTSPPLDDPGTHTLHGGCSTSHTRAASPLPLLALLLLVIRRRK